MNNIEFELYLETLSKDELLEFSEQAISKVPQDGSREIIKEIIKRLKNEE